MFRDKNCHLFHLFHFHHIFFVAIVLGLRPCPSIALRDPHAVAQLEVVTALMPFVVRDGVAESAEG